MDFGFIGSMAVSFFVLLVIILLVMKLARQNVGKREYDERQMLARLRAYRTAFWAVGVYLILNGVFYLTERRSWADPMMTGLIGLCAGLLVYAVLCIFGDAYFAVNDNPKRYLMMFGGLAVLNTGIAITNYSESKPYFQNGMLTYRFMNVFVVILLVIMFLAVCVKLLINKITEQ